MSTLSPVTSLTPMMRQYLEIKARYPDALLMYRMGDFYEMFFEDARQRGADPGGAAHRPPQGDARTRSPMCGVPYHALEAYLGKLLAAGLKVAICDQVEDPARPRGWSSAR